MKSNWFSEVFLPSLVEKAKNNSPKYQDRVILSPKQYEVCLRNMTVKHCYGDYGEFTRFVYETDTHKFLLEEAGKYRFLYIYQK